MQSGSHARPCAVKGNSAAASLKRRVYHDLLPGVSLCMLMKTYQNQDTAWLAAHTCCICVPNMSNGPRAGMAAR